MAEMTAADLFNILCQDLRVTPDRAGECHISCPWCGKEVKRGHNHFSFSERGGYCLICGKSAGLGQLARLLRVDPDRQRSVYAPVVVHHADVRPCNTPRFSELVRRFCRNPHLAEIWSTYKSVPEALIREYHLGFGRFPEYLSRCTHDRLMVPLYDGKAIVGIRGRRLNCNCVKWLSPQGSRCPLFNAHKLPKARGKALWIIENPVDAILLDSRIGDRGTAVATLGVTIWKEEYTDLLRAVSPERVIVAYDNDCPGNGGGEEALAEWRKTHSADIEPNGVRLVNRLLIAGLPARLFAWPKGTALHADIGDLLREGEERGQ